VIRVLIVDDHPVVREGIASALRADPDIGVVAGVGSGAVALAQADRLRPDVVMLDIHLGGVDGFAVCAELTARQRSAVVLVTSTPSASLLRRGEAVGCSGFMGKAAPPEAYRAATRAVAAGGRFIDPGLKHLESAHPQVRLDPVDHRVLALVIEGRTNREIAHNLGLAYDTIKHRVSQLFRKLGARRRSEVATAAARLGLIDPFPSEPIPPVQTTGPYGPCPNDDGDASIAPT
jgi:DNA-binding NarL/FixJ family response regulator